MTMIQQIVLIEEDRAPAADRGGGGGGESPVVDPTELRAALDACDVPIAILAGDRVRLANHAFGALAEDGAPLWQLDAEASGVADGPPPAALEIICRRVIEDHGAGSPVQLRSRRGERVFELRWVPLGDGGGATCVWLVDRTREAGVTSALAAAETWIRQHEQLRVIGELSLGVAHDVHNTLGAIALRIGILKQDAACMAAQGRNIDALDRIVSEGNALVAKLQSIGRLEPPVEEMTGVDLREIIASAIEIAQSGLKLRAAETGVHIHMQMEVPALPPVSGRPEELRQLFVNLLINARDAMPKGGRVVIRGEREHDSSGGADAATPAAVVIRVEDEGTGFPPHVLPRIFDSFFTTKVQAGGTGMGLAMAREVMTRLGGSIDAANRPEGGAAFRFTLPLEQAPTVPAEPAPR